MTLYLLDMAACTALAAAASCKGRISGNHFTGSAVLGCLSGMIVPLVRDGVLGFPAAVLNRGEYLACAVIGALAGALITVLPPKVIPWLARREWQFFCLFDTLGLALSTGVGTVTGLAFNLTVTGSILLGVLSGLAGGMLRDMILSEPARAIEEDYYATAAVMGAVLTVALFLYARCSDWQAALAGAALTALLRLRRRRSNMGG
ncbi:MAG: TRIC cation channel family protein [Desulfovibrio sp.]|jgi:uncharacterized membrane protein YeiH|nr:TRIC cation channel family protein [Desulfovibrio sp.]